MKIKFIMSIIMFMINASLIIIITSDFSTLIIFSILTILVILIDKKSYNHILLFLIGSLTVIIVFYYWNIFFGNSYFMGRTSDDQQYDFLWSYDYLDKYGISPFHLLKHLGPLHNSPGYVYVIIILRYISDILGGVYHTLTPRFLNIYFLLLIAKYSSEIVWYYTKNKKYKTYTLFSIFLYPVMLFNSAHVFRDTIISFILVFIYYIMIIEKSQLKKILSIILSLLTLFYFRLGTLMVSVMIITYLMLSNRRKGVIFVFLSGTLLLIGSYYYFANEWNRLFSQIEMYKSLNVERKGSMGSAIYRLPFFISIVPKITYFIITPTPKMLPAYQFFQSIAVYIKLLFIPFMMIGITSKYIDIKLKVVFAILFLAVVLTTGTFRHVMMYIPFGMMITIIYLHYHKFRLTNKVILSFGILFSMISFSLILITF
jgi:hypothetical protein